MSTAIVKKKKFFLLCPDGMLAEFEEHGTEMSLKSIDLNTGMVMQEVTSTLEEGRTFYAKIIKEKRAVKVSKELYKWNPPTQRNSWVSKSLRQNSERKS